MVIKPNKKQNTAVIYARVSSEEQDREGFSIPAQLNLNRVYAEEHGFEIIDEYIDVETAKRSGRKAFTEMLAFFSREATKIRSGKPGCTVLIVEKTDRLARNFLDLGHLDELGLEIHFVRERHIHSPLSRSSDKLMYGVKAIFAKHYVDNLSEEAAKGMREKASQGMWPTVAPVGYCNVDGPDGKRIIIPDPERAPLVQRLFELYASGNYSLAEITTEAKRLALNRKKSGQTLAKSSIQHMLSNPLYCGYFYWQGVEHQGTYKAIISPELFSRAQEVMTGRKPLSVARNRTNRFLFQGLLKCGTCGCAVVGEVKKGKYIYYHCTGNHGPCEGKKQYLREEVIDAQVAEGLNDLVLDEEILEWMLAILRDSQKEEQAIRAKTLSGIEDQIRQIKRRIEQAYLDRLEGVIDKEFFETQNKKWKEEQSNLEKKAERLQTGNASRIADSANLLELVQRAAILYKNQTMEEKRKLLKIVHSNSTLRDKKFHTNYRKPFDILVETNREQKIKQAASGGESDLCSIWLPGPDSNQRQGG